MQMVTSSLIFLRALSLLIFKMNSALNRKVNAMLQLYLRSALEHCLGQEEDFDVLEESEKESWTLVCAGVVCTFLLTDEAERALQLSTFLMGNPRMRAMILDQLNEEASPCYLTFVAFAM
mmetsp:Transcript_39835/g.29387  ORF Transcript_39835/g.29387 Transcript_39835/m.29387 type:complete len:120 (-) Transcript_39835:204-563(-)|eukprot:CAMPEP_0202980208 /NCGR_PEP_ID=MMETSP1396-20130829/86171_1 /ASSEMBLY_ACC=CAM_ASM_000872 /TAXON_ID= /ORGANISM="Pseudokeronopsis sp., Strain Brazil" /LENGTH=119 /DNA_ID=CAMNT_0049720031 /DNA_START=1442 /DNA_END=1801 /DNA_ORIENTATION=-